MLYHCIPKDLHTCFMHLKKTNEVIKLLENIRQKVVAKLQIGISQMFCHSLIPLHLLLK